jgi:transcriptional regulator
MNAEMLKGHLDNVILATLEQGSAHGYAVIEEIRRRSRGSFNLPEGTVYPALHRLELAGLLASDWVTPDAGRRKRVYTLTPTGKKALKERREGWAEFSRAVGAFLEPDKPWAA